MNETKRVFESTITVPPPLYLLMRGKGVSAIFE